MNSISDGILKGKGGVAFPLTLLILASKQDLDLMDAMMSYDRGMRILVLYIVACECDE